MPRNIKLAMEVFQSAIGMEMIQKQPVDVVTKTPYIPPPYNTSHVVDRSSNNLLDQLDEHLNNRRWSVPKKSLRQTGGIAPMIAYCLAYLSYHLMSYGFIVDINSIDDVLKLIHEFITLLPTKRFRRFLHKKKLYFQIIQQSISDQLYVVAIQIYDYMKYQWLMITTGYVCINYDHLVDDDVLFEIHNLWLSIIMIIISISVINKLLRILSHWV